MVKNPPPSAAYTRDVGRSLNDNTLQYSCLDNSAAKGACLATVYGVPKSWAQLNIHTIGKEEIIGNIH